MKGTAKGHKSMDDSDLKVIFMADLRESLRCEARLVGFFLNDSRFMSR